MSKRTKMAIGSVYNLSYMDRSHKEQNIIFIITSYVEDIFINTNHIDGYEHFDNDNRYYAMILSYSEKNLKDIFEQSNMRFEIFIPDVGDDVSICVIRGAKRRYIQPNSAVLTEI